MNGLNLNKVFWPAVDERKLVGRFYVVESLSETLNVIFIFRFVYLYMVMQRPEWAVIPLLVESIAVLVMEVPTGIVADRFGRKLSVISGGLLTAVAWALVPLSVSFSGQAQLVAVSSCFILSGIGMTLVSGAEQAWVVDNLAYANRKDLVENYFARMRSFASLGGVVAGSLALLLLFSFSISRQLLDLLWYLSAFGLFVAILIAFTIPEHRPEGGEMEDIEADTSFGERAIHGVRLLLRRMPLFYLTLSIVVASFSGAIADEAFDISLVTKGLDARALAPLGIMADLIGMIGPLIGILLVKRFGASSVLAWFLLIPALLVCIFFAGPALNLVVLLYLLLAFFDCVWDPVAEARLHKMIPSSQRATMGSMVNQFSSVADIAGMGVFALLLGQHSEALRQATPDIVEAFSGGHSTVSEVPLGLFGLPIPDLAIVLFVLAGLVAVPFIVLSQWREGQEKQEQST